MRDFGALSTVLQRLSSLGPTYYITQLYCIELISRLCIIFYRIGFELFILSCNFLRCCKVYHVDVGLHYIIV